MTLDAIDDRLAARRRKRQSHRTFGEAIDGRDRCFAQAIAREAAREVPDRGRTDGLGAIHDHAQRSEVEARQIGFIDFAQTQFEGEVRCR